MTDFGLAIRNFVGPGEVPDVQALYAYAKLHDLHIAMSGARHSMAQRRNNSSGAGCGRRATRTLPRRAPAH